MTGWRMGFAANPVLAPKLSLWITHFESCGNQIAQYALKEALDGPQDDVKRMAGSFHERRDLIVKLLNGIKGVKCLSPGGAFYVYPNVTAVVQRLGLKNSEELRRLLLQNGVAVLADSSFGPRNPGETEHYLRLSYATSKEQIIEAASRMKKVMEGRVPPK
jgi:aspartate/methionine/tyrosine aminotransferase